MNESMRLRPAPARWALSKVSSFSDADRWLQWSMAAAIETAKARYPFQKEDAAWKPGRPFRMLLAGYNGSRNTGADVRVAEIVRQLRFLLGDRERLALSVLSLDPSLSEGYFDEAEQLVLPKFFPAFLYEQVQKHDGVVACEGSMFKSKFANALSTMMVGALGLAGAEHKIAVGYGGEAGVMDPSLEALVRRYCQSTLVLARSPQSREVLDRLGIRCMLGTDSAWTFESRDPQQGRKMLEDAGWDGKKPVIAVAPINPFWWPVRPDLWRFTQYKLRSAHEESHYASIYFHHSGEDVVQAQRRYIDAIASALRTFREKHSAFVVIVGMEALDRKACEQLDRALGGGNPLFVSDQNDMHAMVSMLRQVQMLVASRYHAIVTSMPAGVPSIGITMDERIRNLMIDRGHEDYLFNVDAPNLQSGLLDAMLRMMGEREQVTQEIEACVVRNLRRMGGMGLAFLRHFAEKYPDFPLQSRLRESENPWDFLPPLSAKLTQMVERHPDDAAWR